MGILAVNYFSYALSDLLPHLESLKLTVLYPNAMVIQNNMSLKEQKTSKINLTR